MKTSCDEEKNNPKKRTDDSGRWSLFVLISPRNHGPLDANLGLVEKAFKSRHASDDLG
jgi:hypothetical protein